MARIKVTQQNIMSKLQIWAQGNNLTDELIFRDGEINQGEVIDLGWKNGVIIEAQPDRSIFKKFIYVEKLS